MQSAVTAGGYALCVHTQLILIKVPVWFVDLSVTYVISITNINENFEI